MTNQEIIDKAIELIEGPRREAYGPVEESFTRIAQAWSAIADIEITSKQVALMMIAFKVCREANSHSDDNIVDIIGYALLANTLS